MTQDLDTAEAAGISEFNTVELFQYVARLDLDASASFDANMACIIVMFVEDLEKEGLTPNRRWLAEHLARLQKGQHQ